MTTLLTKAALAAIRFYQRHLSPLKGFRCAYCAHTGHASCSVLGYRAIRRHGVIKGVGLLDQRLFKCHAAAVRYGACRPAPPRVPAHLQRQAGFCDIDGCDGFDLPASGGKSCSVRGCAWPTGSDVCKVLECLDCLDCFDWGRDRRRKKRQYGDLDTVTLPPRRDRNRKGSRKGSRTDTDTKD